MMHDYKGWRSTRLQLIVLTWLMSCYFLIFALIGADVWERITFGSVITYALSELGVKGVSAYKIVKGPSE